MVGDFRRPCSLLVMISLSVFLLVVAPMNPLESAERRTDRLRVTAPDTVDLTDRDTAAVTVTLNLASGWHINTNEPIQDYLIPTELSLSGTPPELLDVQYPSGKTYSFAFSEEEILVYSDTTPLDATVRVRMSSRPARQSSYARDLKLTYQPCSDHQCLRPKTIRLPVRFQLKENRSR